MKFGLRYASLGRYASGPAAVEIAQAAEAAGFDSIWTVEHVAYATQARAPLFDTAPFELRGRPATTGRGAELWAVTPEGTIAMSAEVELA